MSTVNMVRYYFYKENFPRTAERMQALVSLAYQTARDRKLHPKVVLIRSEVHDTTSFQGKHQKDPLGWHITLCYKDVEQLTKGTHTTSHGYVKGKEDLGFVTATHDPEKADAMTKSNGQPVWPSEDKLKEAPEIGYGHLAEESKE
ncbi:hypothetical protein FQN54_008304 [Arachnomyces sp. PD_36]|nr:hypothetical protein FQN54_008304 [Arachnomyces sp. PD_36]